MQKRTELNKPLIPGFEEFLSELAKTVMEVEVSKMKHSAKEQKRSKPSIRATLLSSLLGGEKKCPLTAWFSAHYKFDKLRSDFDFSTHNEVIEQRAAQHEAKGLTVLVKKFLTAEGKRCIVKSKPDLVVIENLPVIEICKLGERKNAHLYQVLIYMLIYPHTPQGKRLCQGQIPNGRLIYPHGIVEIDSSEVDDKFKEFFRQTVALISNPNPPNPEPSLWECRYCNVPNCSSRINQENETNNHNLF